MMQKSVHIVRDDKSPATSPNTRLVAAALTSGARFAFEKSFVDTAEELPGGGHSRQVAWCMDAEKTVTFEPIAAAEEIGVVEFIKRYNSPEWCAANANHPIAYMQGFSEMLNRLRDFLKTQKPAVLIRRGKRYAIIPADCSAARKAEVLSMLNA